MPAAAVNLGRPWHFFSSGADFVTLAWWDAAGKKKNI